MMMLSYVALSVLVTWGLMQMRFKLDMIPPVIRVFAASDEISGFVNAFIRVFAL